MFLSSVSTIFNKKISLLCFINIATSSTMTKPLRVIVIVGWGVVAGEGGGVGWNRVGVDKNAFLCSG